MKKVVYLHGNGSTSWDFGFGKWLKEEVDKLGIESRFELMPDSIICRKKYWLPFMKEKLHIDENTIIVGWSTGAVAAMKYAEENKVGAFLLIGPCYTDLGDELEIQSGWYEGEWKWNDIKKNTENILMYYSEDDPFIPLEEFEYIEDKLAPEKVSRFQDRGHFINEYKFEEVLKEVKKLVS